ncbi:MAG: spermidine synthase [Betaproteobacteria bacterium]|nr:MAG: spermidine synthase [Betaproteobacteria bacterium]
MRFPAGADVRALFALFALSGFTGLIYESLWSHYLKLFLGAAAFAQSFVLAAFMGGMALGAWLASRWSARLRNLLAAYGWVEAAIGLAALAFDPVFTWLTQTSLDRVIPALGSPDAVEAYKYALCALLIVPQTVLLGMTFPLLSGAVIRRGPESSGHHLALLYFTNSIGAAIGALAAGFWLLAWLGLPGTMRFGGATNLALAAIVLWLARGGEPGALTALPVAGAPATDRRIVRLLLAAAFITGAASFVYEIAWIRMLSLVLGASFQAFELMLSAFITGLALGGLWARKRIDRLQNPLRFGGLVQLGMGLAALATLYVYHFSFDWMEWALSVLRRENAAYPLFNLFSHAIAFAVMLPATFLAGVTLPLFTYALLRGGHGERAIGQVYAANTLGAIAGVLITVHLFLPGVGVKLALILGAALDMLLGAWLLRASGARRQRAEGFAAVIIGMLAATLSARAAVLDPERLSSGVFRYGKAQPDRQRVAFYRDGKTASVAVRAGPNSVVSITTNGKPDASIRLDPSLPPIEDEYTMVLLGALPLLLKPDARAIANIGFGSGLTAEVVLAHGAPRVLDTVEIEPAMVAGAHSFAPRVRRPFSDPRSHVHYEDAKSYFARHARRYDVIISEPSNPWVNGVASLFTTEFYRDIKRHLAPQGLFVQWLHHYEFDDRLLGSVFAALAENFQDFEVWEASRGDLIAVAVSEGRVPRLQDLPQREAAFLEQLARIGVTEPEHLAVRRLGNRRRVLQLFAPFAAPVNSDFRPFVQLEAGRARFAARSAYALPQLALAPVPVNEMLGGVEPAFLSVPVALAASTRLLPQNHALELHQALLDVSGDPSRVADADLRATLLALKPQRVLCAPEPSPHTLEQLHFAAELTLAHLGPAKRRSLWVEPRWTGCAPRDMAPEVRQRFELYSAVAQRDAARMSQLARALLDGGPMASETWARFVLLAGLVGGHASSQSDAARQLWRDHGGRLYPNATAPPYVTLVANWRP